MEHYQSVYLTREQAAVYLNLAPKTLANLAALGKGPLFTRRPGGKRAEYRLLDLDAFRAGEQPPAPVCGARMGRRGARR